MHQKIALIPNIKIYSGFEISNVPFSGQSVTLRNSFAAKNTYKPELSRFRLLSPTTYIFSLIKAKNQSKEFYLQLKLSSLIICNMHLNWKVSFQH